MHREEPSELTRTSHIKQSLDRYLSGESGVPFELLSRFAEPLFELYQVDPRSSTPGSTATREAEELALMVSVLDTSRLFLAYLVLDPADGYKHLEAFEKHLLGREATEAERNDLQILLRTIDEHWQSLDSIDRQLLHECALALPRFDVLLEQYSPAEVKDLSPTGPERFGPDGLDLPEAMALFVRPLLEDPAVHADPDTLEDCLARAYAYWDLACSPRSEYLRQLKRIKRNFALTPDQAAVIEAEARRMVQRFFKLFPEQREKRTS